MSRKWTSEQRRKYAQARRDQRLMDKERRHEIKIEMIRWFQADSELKWMMVAAGGVAIGSIERMLAAQTEQEQQTAIEEFWDKFGVFTAPGLALAVKNLDASDLAALTLPGLVAKMFDIDFKGGDGIAAFGVAMLVLGRMGGVDGMGKMLALGG